MGKVLAEATMSQRQAASGSTQQAASSTQQHGQAGSSHVTGTCSSPRISNFAGWTLICRPGRISYLPREEALPCEEGAP